MLDTFKIAFKLKNTYGANSFIYSLQSLPIIKKMLPDSLYAAKGLKEFACIVSIFWEIGSTFLRKLLYLLLMVFLPMMLMEGDSSDAFIHILFFLTLEGGMINTRMFDATRDKYYAIFLMRMDARKYTLTDYLYFLLKTFVGFLPFTLLFGLLSGLNIVTCLLIPCFVAAVKNIVTASDLRSALKEEPESSKKASFLDWIKVGINFTVMVALIVIAYVLPYFTELILTEEIFWILAALALLAGIVSMVYIWRFPGYRTIYKKKLTADQFLMNTTKETVEIQENLQEKIVVDLHQTSQKTGYGYLNDLLC